ncbi:alpha/beta fold hydrolase [Duganella sp. Root1480D1]|uniref:alpha/beta fold hydrolase n=1 Tax=Duganella sp. Root1480D1 TaxID=1736471 RepID=UPI000709A99F|nr:alpha/beta hydrolase [Duganella sp. Root1480D1]KQZ31822.1 alpha/beta hydrolase [Duganella sp. Root1480D1]
MKSVWLGFAALCLSTSALAQTCAESAPCMRARAAVEDLTRIVAPEGVQETYKTQIGGIDQWINVRGQDKSNPMILFVHGGPASPTMPTTWQWQRPIEEYFTVAHYDQRAVGKTLRANDKEAVAGTLRIDRFVDDAIEVAEHLRAKYKKDKLIIIGHSWGTIVSTRAVLKRPDLFYAYVGIGQIANMRENERISYDFGIEQARKHNNTEALKEMESIAPYPGNEPITRERIIIARKWPQYYGGLSAYKSDSVYFFRAPMLSPEYDQADWEAIDQGSQMTLGTVLKEWTEVDFSSIRQFPVPVVMFLGRHDYTTPTEPVVKWMAQLKAPYKQSVWFEHSAHMMPWEEPGKTLESLLTYVRPLALKGGKRSTKAYTAP